MTERPITWDGQPLCEETKRRNADGLARAQALSDRFYREAQATGVHAIIEHTGFLNEHLKILRKIHEAGHDINMFNEHCGARWPMAGYEAAYIAEKFMCMFAPMFTPETWQLFVEECGKKLAFPLPPADPEHRERAERLELEEFEEAKRRRAMDYIVEALGPAADMTPEERAEIEAEWEH